MSMLQMSLFYPLTHNFELWPTAYQCPPGFETSETRWPVFGSYLMISGVLFMAVYTPCFLAIVKMKARTPAYQLMLISAIIDISSLFASSLASGYLSYYGIHFCQYPLFFFFIGDIASGGWMVGCLASILLGMERCSEVNPKFIFSFLFEKKIFRLVMAILILYSIFSLFFNKPMFFNSECACFLYDPSIGKDPSLYPNFAHAVNNLVAALMTTVLYFHLCMYLLFKQGYSTSMWLYKSKRQIILQGVILCFFHATAALLYEYMQHFDSPQWLKIMGHVVWQWSSGCLCIVYLTLNRTVRDAVLKIVMPKVIRKWLGIYIGVEEHLALEHALDNSGGVAVTNSVGMAVKIGNFFPV